MHNYSFRVSLLLKLKRGKGEATLKQWIAFYSDVFQASVWVTDMLKGLVAWNDKEFCLAAHHSGTDAHLYNWIEHLNMSGTNVPEVAPFSILGQRPLSRTLIELLSVNPREIWVLHIAFENKFGMWRNKQHELLNMNDEL